MVAAAGYLTRYVDAALRTFIPLADGITLQSARSRAKSWRGSRLFYDELMAMPIPLAERLKGAMIETTTGETCVFTCWRRFIC